MYFWWKGGVERLAPSPCRVLPAVGNMQGAGMPGFTLEWLRIQIERYFPKTCVLPWLPS
jgi:hypothetical protein